MPYQPQLRSDLEQRLAQLDPELRLLEPEEPGFDAFLAQVTALDPTLARRMDEAIIDDQAQEARQMFGKAGSGLTIGSLAGSAFNRAKGKSVRGEKRVRPVTFAAVGAAAVAAIFLFTAFVPDSRASTAKAQTSTPGTPESTTPGTPVAAASTTPGVPATSDLPTSTVAVTPAPTPVPITQASTPAPAPTPEPDSAPAPVSAQTPAPVPLSAQQTPVLMSQPGGSGSIAPVPLPVSSTPKPAQATLIPPAPTRAFTALSVPVVAGTGAARTAITSTSGETPQTARTAVVQAVSAPETQPRTSALTGSPAPAQSAPVQALSAQAQSAQRATTAFVESDPGAGGSVAASSAGGAYGLTGSGSAPVSSSRPSASGNATTQNDAPASGVQEARKTAAPASESVAGLQAASAGTYSPGSVLTLHLDTGVAVTAGLSQHVWALADDGSVWRGTATLDEKTSRIGLTFSAVLKAGRQVSVNAYAESADGEGIGDHVQVVTKDQAQAVMNGLLGAVVGFVQSQSEKTTTVSQGYSSESEKPQNFWLALGSGLASSFVLPDTKATSVQLGQLKKGEDVRVRVDVAGSAGS